MPHSSKAVHGTEKAPRMRGFFMRSVLDQLLDQRRIVDKTVAGALDERDAVIALAFFDIHGVELVPGLEQLHLAMERQVVFDMHIEEGTGNITLGLVAGFDPLESGFQ